MSDLSHEYSELAVEQERAYGEEQRARELLEELDERRYRGDNSVTAVAVLAARHQWLKARARLAGIQGRMRDNRRLAMVRRRNAPDALHESETTQRSGDCIDPMPRPGAAARNSTAPGGARDGVASTYTSRK